MRKDLSVWLHACGVGRGELSCVCGRVVSVSVLLSLVFQHYFSHIVVAAKVFRGTAKLESQTGGVGARCGRSTRPFPNSGNMDGASLFQRLSFH